MENCRLTPTKESVHKGEGIAGRVLATGVPLLIEDISTSEFARY